MVIMEGLLMEVVSIVIQDTLNPLYQVVKDGFQFTSEFHSEIPECQ
jgi:hypothetical protein